jgi:hypothetical protein
MIPRPVWLSALAVALMTTVAIAAHGPYRVPPPRASVSVQIEDEEGRRLETFTQRGQTFVLGQHGQRYNVRVTNRSGARVEVVVAVDGRDAVSGQVTDLVRHRGYVVPAHGSVLVQGFRTSFESVAAFRFTDPSNSYASRMGTPQRVGIIQVAAYDERAIEPRPLVLPDDRPWLRDLERRGAPQPGEGSAPPPRRATPPSSEAAPTAGATQDRAGRIRPPRQEGNLGTEFGEQRTSRVVEVDFERTNPRRPSQWITIRYDDARGLEARGILVHPQLPMPRPLPLVPEPGRFAPPPPPPISPWDLPLGQGAPPAVR